MHKKEPLFSQYSDPADGTTLLTAGGALNRIALTNNNKDLSVEDKEDNNKH